MLLSFVANEDITEGTAVAVLEAPLGVIRAIDPLNFADARSVGIAVDTVSSGALCRVISKGEASFFDGLEPGERYYAPLSGTAPVVYSGFADVFNTIVESGAYLCELGIAVNATSLSVNLDTPVFMQKDSLT
jgi:hypothetical protein|tara:strand:+ start:205 stop:600 length:396 start_codon:yes stop_codon:yes gene_type:complete